MSEGEVSEVIIEPKEKVVEALRLAVAETGLNDFLRRTGANPQLLERWLNGEEWIPLRVVREACNINTTNPNAPNHSKVLFECMAGAAFKVSLKGVTESRPPIRKEKRVEVPEEIKRRNMESLVSWGTALSFLILFTGVVGFFLGYSYGPTEAAIGALVGMFLGWISVAFIYFFKFFKKPT